MAPRARGTVPRPPAVPPLQWQCQLSGTLTCPSEGRWLCCAPPPRHRCCAFPNPLLYAHACRRGSSYCLAISLVSTVPSTMNWEQDQRNSLCPGL